MRLIYRKIYLHIVLFTTIKIITNARSQENLTSQSLYSFFFFIFFLVRRLYYFRIFEIKIIHKIFFYLHAIKFLKFLTRKIQNK